MGERGYIIIVVKCMMDVVIGRRLGFVKGFWIEMSWGEVRDGFLVEVIIVKFLNEF